MSDHIPQEVMTNILQRLSVKDLVRCRRVSKQWLAIIDDPDFISNKLRRSLSTNSNAALFVHDREDIFLSWKKDYTTNDFDTSCFFSSLIEYDRNQVLLMGSCHGLICFCLFDRPHDFVVANPSTGERRTFSSPIKEEDGDKLAAFGFGYDELSDDYKAVRIIRTDSYDWTEDFMRNNKNYRAEICSVRGKGISRTVQFPGWGNEPERWMGASVSGTIHWCTKSKLLVNRQRKCHYEIHAIDLGSSAYGQLQLPDCNFCQGGFEYLNVGVVDSCLSLCALCRDVKRVSIWVMKEYGIFESWNMIYSLECVDQVPWSITSVGSDGGLILLMVDYESFVFCDPMKNGVGRISVLGVDSSLGFDCPNVVSGLYEAVYCLESLVRVFPDQMVGEEEDYEEHHQKLADQGYEEHHQELEDFLDLVYIQPPMYDEYDEFAGIYDEFDADDYY